MTRASVLPSQADIERATKAAVRGFQAATGRTADQPARLPPRGGDAAIYVGPVLGSDRARAWLG